MQMAARLADHGVVLVYFMETILNFLCLCLAIAMLIPNAIVHAQSGAGRQLKDDPRVDTLLSRLTLEEKILLLGGVGFETKPITRLGIPPLNMTDGPVGVRWKQSSAFPVSIMMTATWNPGLIERVGAALGREAKAKGRRMLLGPCVNIHRTPFGGRNFESFGEDPYLAARTTVSFVRGVQSERVIATAKHFACNNQEHERDFTNVTVGERALREIYLPAFEAAVKEGGTMSVMSAYNKVNGAWCSENPVLLTDILKNEWGFTGFVVSDWGAVHSIVPTVNAGLDVEMPFGRYLNADSLLPALKSGEIRESTINDKVRRLLRTIVWAGLLDGSQKDTGAVNTPDHRSIALNVAREGIVLLKNEGNTLPFERRSIKRLAVIGPNAAIARTGGGGSSKVNPLYAVSPLTALREKLGAGVELSFAAGCRGIGDLDPIPAEMLIPPPSAGSASGVRGLKGEYFNNINLDGTPTLTRIDARIDFSWSDGAPDTSLPVDGFSARWTGSLVPAKTARYTLHTVSDDGVRLYVDGKLLIDDWTDHAAEIRRCAVDFVAGKKYDIRVEYYERGGGAMMRLGWTSSDDTLIGEAVQAAKKADAVLLCVGLSEFYESEGFDRKTLALPEEQIKLVSAVAAANHRTVVALNSGAPVLMDGWLDAVPALIENWYPGEEGGNALAEVLFGDVNPSGRLPVTFLRRWEDSPVFGHYPGRSAVDYAEGIFVGYRHFDRAQLEVLFPFGHGLSYATFAYSDLSVSSASQPGALKVDVSVDIQNTGTRSGAEVVQLYVHAPASPVERPEKELKGFRKLVLGAGEKETVRFTLDARSFAYFDTGRREWVAPPGEYEIFVGKSSRDILLQAKVRIP
jgi:beta-glucosidase